MVGLGRRSCGGEGLEELARQLLHLHAIVGVGDDAGGGGDPDR